MWIAPAEAQRPAGIPGASIIGERMHFSYQHSLNVELGKINVS
jgi:hypothetical protein